MQENLAVLGDFSHTDYNHIVGANASYWRRATIREAKKDLKLSDFSILVQTDLRWKGASWLVSWLV